MSLRVITGEGGPLSGVARQVAAARDWTARSATAIVPARVRRALAIPIVHGAIVLVIVLLLLSSWGVASYNSYVALLICVYAIATLGLNIPAGFGGALSLGQGAPFAVGAYAVGILGAHHGWPVWLVLPVALVLGLVVGLAMGAPAGRLGVIGLAMVSLGFTLVVADLLLQLSDLTGGSSGIANIVPLKSFHGQPYLSPWLVPGIIVGCTLAAYVFHSAYRTSRFGRAALAIRDERLGATAIGVSTYWVQVLGFTVGAGLGALSGGLFSYLSLFLSPDAVSTQLSILLLVMVVLGGAGSRVGPLLGALILGVVPLWLDKYPHLNAFIYGGLLIVLMLVRPNGIISGTAAPVADPFRDVRGDDDPAEAIAPSPAGIVREPVLEVRGVSRSFGGVAAVRSVDLTVHAGEILGLIGPNGSGKTTMLNVISGLYPPQEGQIMLRGESIESMRPARIADLGVGRTFQTPKAFPALSVAEHLRVAGEHGAARDAAKALAGARAARELMRSGGLDPDDPAVLRRPTGQLAHGQLRFLEMAMAVYRSPDLLLLDEPAAGLAHSEIEALERVIRRLADGGMGVIIVEHHIDLISRLVDTVAVLNLGSLLWSGPPEQLHETEEVRVAYLGTTA
jgi:ABC-type branched-subunit amino acid transport system ATPase component/ABC-type branched-subunit amino acid transport system permease subunit